MILIDRTLIIISIVVVLPLEISLMQVKQMIIGIIIFIIMKSTVSFYLLLNVRGRFSRQLLLLRSTVYLVFSLKDFELIQQSLILQIINSRPSLFLNMLQYINCTLELFFSPGLSLIRALLFKFAQFFLLFLKLFFQLILLLFEGVKLKSQTRFRIA